MLHYDLRDTDLGSVRFGISPLCEMGLSLRAVKRPSRYPLQLPWLSRTQEARKHLDLRILLNLVNDNLWTPDFLNPRPSSPLTRIDDELALLQELDPAQFTHQLVSLHGFLPEAFRGQPRAVLGRIVIAFQEYWEACFASYWPRMRTILESDITFRGRIMATGGQSEMLNDLASSMSFEGSRITLHLARPHSELTVKVDGRGVTLVPTMFVGRPAGTVDLNLPPVVIYPARGQGAMWEAENIVNPVAIAKLLGKSRAKLLTALGAPASSTELGIRFGVSTSAINQHLRALQAAGLVTSVRHGRSVLYFRSPLGSALLGTDELFQHS